MNVTVDKLKAWGCDTDAALERFVNDEEMYVSFLPYVSGEKAFAALGEAIASGDVHKAFEEAHSLKGILGNMGLTPMYEADVRIVEQLRKNKLEGVDTDYALLMNLKAEYDIIIK